MNYEFYCIYDKVAGLYALPFANVNEACAIRQFKSILSQGEYEPTDFDLFFVGSFDSNTGKFVAVDLPKFICHGGIANAQA